MEKTGTLAGHVTRASIVHEVLGPADKEDATSQQGPCALGERSRESERKRSKEAASRGPCASALAKRGERDSGVRALLPSSDL